MPRALVLLLLVYGRRTLELVNVPRGWYVKSIRYAGNEIIDGPTTFKDSEEPAIEVLLSNRGGSSPAG